MKLSAPREAILKPLQTVIGVVERRHTMPILANVLLSAREGRLKVAATDLEVELLAETEVEPEIKGEITVPGRKLHDICRALPEDATLKLSVMGDRVTLVASRSRFTLSSLQADDFPVVDEIAAQQDLRVDQHGLSKLLEKTHFSMAQQDVRYYLNGLLLETDGNILRAVATDGHRLALSELELDTPACTQRASHSSQKGCPGTAAASGRRWRSDCNTRVRIMCGRSSEAFVLRRN